MTQKEALDLLKLGHNVFLTGPAGSGKTYLLNQYIKYLKTNGIPVGITASTGIASTHMGGTTIHSWAGIGIKDMMHEKDIEDLFKRQYLRNRFKNTKVLIIDEISMLHAHRLDMVDLVCRTFKRNSLPFGGLQVIMCGDFFQLPPVTKREKSEPTSRHSRVREDDSRVKSDFVTESNIWKGMQLQVCYLDEQHRQDDRAFLRVLNDIRNSDVTEMTVEYLSERLDRDTKGYTKPTRLFTHNADVDAINQKHLDELDGESQEFLMNWRGSFGLTEVLKKSCLAPQTLVLKKGAQVMFVKNNYEVGYVNGTLGEVINFDKDGFPVVRTFDGAEITVTRASWEVKEEEKELAAIAQLPLRLAWAITVHKSQGMSLDAAEVDLSRSFIPGMGYVALSRVRSLQGLKLMGMNQMALQVNQEVAEMDREFIRQSNEGVLYLHSLDQEKILQKQIDFLQYLKS
ncbi:MAG: AAA family ATPase [Candidatus Levybacteria bacterium]|nr:AAA family ATPase [Candidatus Levybacteria bacterium]